MALSGWNAWRYYRQINISNFSMHSNFLSNTKSYCINFAINTQNYVNAGKMQASCKDLRILNSNSQEVPRFIQNPNSTRTRVYFRIPTLGATSYVYYMIYGNPGAGNPITNPRASYHNGYGGLVFHFYDDWSEHSLTSTDVTPLTKNTTTRIYKVADGMYMDDSVAASTIHMRGAQVLTRSQWTGGFRFRCVATGVSGKSYRVGFLGPSLNLLAYLDIGKPTSAQAQLVSRSLVVTTFGISSGARYDIDLIGGRHPNVTWPIGSTSGGGGQKVPFE